MVFSLFFIQQLLNGYYTMEICPQTSLNIAIQRAMEAVPDITGELDEDSFTMYISDAEEYGADDPEDITWPSDLIGS